VVVQADSLNRSQIGTVLLVPLTRTLKWAAAPGNVSLRGRDTGLKHRSVANVSQLTATDRRRLRERAGSLPGAALARVDDGLKLVLGLAG
jgi:mRNA-degrading endonuclease toxin of MazEF toxin-antitoxin module